MRFIIMILLILSCYRAFSKDAYFIEKMIKIDSCSYIRGNITSFPESHRDETPVHKATISYSFYIGKFEISQADWENVMGYNNSVFHGKNRPVENISWFEAIEFCNNLSKIDGLEPCYIIENENVICDFEASGYRLPTDVEWECASRAGTSTDIYSGNIDNFDCFPIDNNENKIAWYCGNSNNETHNVGKKDPNSYGLFDMIGNVWEWVWDWYDSKYYEEAPSVDPRGPIKGRVHVMRGGCFGNRSAYCRASDRNCPKYLKYKSEYVGFRIVRTASTKTKIHFQIVKYNNFNEISALDLGKICLGDTKTGYAAVKNFSDFGLQLKPPVFTDSEHFSGEFMRGDSLFWNDTLGVRIHIAPDKTGPIETMMYIYCNEDDAVMDSLLIKALVVEPGMEISNDIDFGYVKFGKRPEKTFTIHNTGTSDLYISDLNEFDLPFRISETDPAIPAVLIPGDSMIVTMTVQGTAEEEYFDTLSIETQKIGEACPIDGFVNLHTITLRYELKANDIDYGFVADCKTPQDTVRLVNCGAAPVELLDEGYLNNKDDFEIVSATPMGTVLNFLDTAFYVIRFTPQAPDGLKTGELRIKTDHPEEEFRTVRLRGETESVNLTAENISFGNVGINRNSTLKCVLTNHNGFELTISEIIENHAWLEIQPQSFTIPAGENYEIDTKIKLSDPIDYSAWPQIIIQGPCPDTVAFRIDATGIKSSVEVTPICNYNETEFCQSKTMDIEIKNTGKLPISLLSGEIQGADKELFSFEDNYENIEILPGESIIEKVIFTPESSINGPKTAQARNIILIDMVEVEFITELQGERYTILYDIPEFVSVSARISENATEQIELKNTAEYDFTIEEINLENAAEFSIAPDMAGRKINAGLSEMLTVSLFSGIAGEYEDKIYIKFNGPFCEYRDTIDISGIVKHENLILFPETSGTIGDPDFRIPLMVNLNSTEDVSGLSYTAEISLDAYLYDLSGIDNATILSNEISGRERILSISGENISLSKGEQAIAELSGGLLLSDIRECELKINSFEWDSPYIDNSTQNGLLKVEEICIGDLRAISTFAIPGITACPNPATGQIEINLSGDISNLQSLEIYDSQGKLLRELPINSKDNIKINIQELSSGLYFLILKTATGIYYDKLVVE